MKYLGIEPYRPRIAVFDFTSCEGCELQLANKEETLVPFLQAIDVVSFREVSSAHSDDYEIALVEGSITRADEVDRIKRIRKQAKVLVALGSCACFGGVHRLKNDIPDLDAANREIYGDLPKPTLPTRSLHQVVDVDLQIPGCPVSKAEVERIVQHLIWDVQYQFPASPVCLECKQRYTVCTFEKGQLCLGPITMGGCEAPCPAAGQGCWGCRGPAEEPNFSEFFNITQKKGFSRREVDERLHFFGGFEGIR